MLPKTDLSFLTRGHEWLAAIPRSVNSSATSSLRIGAARSVWIVDGFGAIACFAQVASIRGTGIEPLQGRVPGASLIRNPAIVE